MRASVKSYIRRTIYFDAEETITPLFYLFLISSTAWVVGLSFFAGSQNVQESALYSVLHEVSPTTRFIWAWTGVAVMAGNLLAVFIRRPLWSTFVATCGFSLWAFASIAFFNDGDFLRFFSIAVPNTLFWVWYYFEAKRYERVIKIKIR